MPIAPFGGLGDVFWGFATGRHREIEYRATGTLDNFASIQLGTATPGQPPPDLNSTAKKFNATSILNGPDPLNPPILECIAGSGRNLGWYVHVYDGFGGDAAHDGRADYNVPPAFPGGPARSGSNPGDYEMTWTLSRVDEYAYLYFLNEGVAGANGDPTYGGPATSDLNPRAIGIAYYEVLMPGANVSSTVSVTGPLASAQTSCVTTISIPWLVDYTAILDVFGETGANDISGTGTGKMLGDWEECGPEAGVSDTSGFVDVSILRNELSITVRNFKVGGTPNPNGHVRLRAQPDREYRVTGALYALDKPYPGSLPLAIQGAPSTGPTSVTLAPTGSEEFRMRTWLAERKFGAEYMALAGVSEWDKIRTALGGLTAAGEDRRDWVTMIAGKSYPALRVSHAETLALPTLSGSPGAYRHDFGTPRGNWEGYAYLRLNLRTGAKGDKVRVTVEGDPQKEYELVTTDEDWKDYDVDLLLPILPEDFGEPKETDDEPGAVDLNPDLWDSRSPLRNDGQSHYDPYGWGVGRVRSYRIEGVPTLEVRNPKLARKTKPKHDAMVAFLDWETTQSDESYHADGSVGAVPIVQGARALVVTVDGRRSLIEPGSVRQLMADAEGNLLWVYGSRTARDIRQAFQSCPGYAADESPYVPRDGWHALDGSEGANYITGGPIFYAGWPGFHDGGGVLWNGESPVNVLGRELGEPQTIQYQVRYHELIGYPGMGDCWNDSGDRKDPTSIRVAKILRSAVEGVAEGAATETVRLRDEGGVEVSSAVVNDRSRFRMGPLPYGRGQKDHAVSLRDLTGELKGEWDYDQGLGEAKSEQRRFNARRFHRAVFRRMLTERGKRRCVSYDVDLSSGFHVRATIEGDELVIRTADPHLQWRVRPTGIPAKWACVRIDRTDSGQALFVAVQTPGDAIAVYRSGNDGESWTMSRTYGAGEFPTLAIGRDGLRYCYWLRGTSVIGRIVDRADHDQEGEFVAMGGVDEDSGCAADESVRGSERRVHLLAVVNGQITEWDSTDGVEFT